jgi:hypothetical protein
MKRNVSKWKDNEVKFFKIAREENSKKSEAQNMLEIPKTSTG